MVPSETYDGERAEAEVPLPSLLRFRNLLRRVEYSRVVSPHSLTVYRGLITRAPDSDCEQLLWRLHSSKAYQYRTHQDCNSQGNVPLKEIFEASTLLNIRNGVKIITSPKLFPDVLRGSVDTFFTLDSLDAFMSQEGRRADYTSALEIGVGAGFIAKAWGFLFPNLQVIHCLDLNQSAVRCAIANLDEFSLCEPKLRTGGGQYSCDLMLSSPYSDHPIAARVWEDDARKAELDRYDFVCCLPPYVPRLPSATSESPSWWAGLDLIPHAVSRELLNPNGRILITVSDGSAGDLVRECAAKENLKILYTRKTEVGFRIWEALKNDALRRHLLSKGFIRRRGRQFFQDIRTFLLGRVGDRPY